MKKENLGSVKALKKQLGAAVAMVCVAAVALGSSTYAWFVSNNNVTATTTSIYAQSNSAYLLIASAEDTTTTGGKGAVKKDASEDSPVALYPATWTQEANVKVDNGTNASKTWLFASGYAKDPGKPDINDDGLFAITSKGKETGSPEAASEEKYAYLNTFHVGTGDYDGSFTNLKVSNMAITVTGNNELSGALRVLIKCGNAWVVGKVTTTNGASTFSIENQSDTDGIIRAAAFGKSATGDGEVTGDVDVDVYVYYEGSDAKVFSDNLSKINADGVSATVTFTATPATTAQGA